MLADSVEAVVRAAKDRSHERIDELVDAVINERVDEGRLEECEVSLRLDDGVLRQAWQADEQPGRLDRPAA